jgi:phospholipid/cholesterol/gamma-HCH transport system permease protein
VIGRGRASLAGVDFLGETMLGIWRLLRGRTRHQRASFTAALQEAGPETLPVLALFATASGLVLTLLGLQELDKFGVSGVAPRLVGIVILRELGALMTGIALAGRVAAAFAAEIATAVASGERDAIRDTGLAPVDVLVAPRVLAATVAGPLLVAYANGLALLGSTVLGSSMTGVTFMNHFQATLSALNVKHAIAGLTKGAFFGFSAGMAAGWYGLRSERSAASASGAVKNAAVAAAVGVALVDLVLTFVFKWIRL